jgi:hypothetical protein
LVKGGEFGGAGIKHEGNLQKRKGAQSLDLFTATEHTFFSELSTGEQNCCASIDDTKLAVLIHIKAAATHDRRHSHNRQLKVSF